MREALKQFSDVCFLRRGSSIAVAFGRIATFNRYQAYD
ncbi:hypothetical protein CES86_0763 [Brucella lupini]|uniref:Uncharacterized protein n=1 Tax=Brucella lupini TaxID=255457 RepID=A0A256GX55_9HYPH|nr:hypothetical protein CES86_0763 [Brucella lupini]